MLAWWAKYLSTKSWIFTDCYHCLQTIAKSINSEFGALQECGNVVHLDFENEKKKIELDDRSRKMLQRWAFLCEDRCRYSRKQESFFRKTAARGCIPAGHAHTVCSSWGNVEASALGSINQLMRLSEQAAAKTKGWRSEEATAKSKGRR